jgi:hypothetical protein
MLAPAKTACHRPASAEFSAQPLKVEPCGYGRLLRKLNFAARFSLRRKVKESFSSTAEAGHYGFGITFAALTLACAVR